MNIDQPVSDIKVVDYECTECGNKIVLGKGHKADCSSLINKSFKSELLTTLKKHETAIEEAIVDNKPKNLFDQSIRSLKELKNTKTKLTGALMYNTTMAMLGKKKELTVEEQELHNKKVDLKKKIKLLKKSNGNTEEIKRLRKEVLSLVKK